MIKNFLRRYLWLPVGIGSVVLTIYLANYWTKHTHVINTLLEDRPEVDEDLPSAPPTAPVPEDENTDEEGVEEQEDKQEEQDKPSEAPQESEPPKEEEKPNEEEPSPPEESVPESSKPDSENPTEYELSKWGEEEIADYIVKKVNDINRNTSKWSNNVPRLINTWQANSTIVSLIEAITEYSKKQAASANKPAS